MLDQNRKISEDQQAMYASIDNRQADIKLEECRPFLENIAATNPKRELTVIDIGGGAGFFSAEVKNFFVKKGIAASIIVIDPCQYDSWDTIAGINFINESAFAALNNFDDGFVDIIFFNGVLHHLVTESYVETRKTQVEILRLAREKLSPSGYIFIRECYYYNPFLRSLSMPIVYYMTTSRLRPFIYVSKMLGSKSAGVGVCFLSRPAWSEIFLQLGFDIAAHSIIGRRTVMRLMIKELFFTFVIKRL